MGVRDKLTDYLTTKLNANTKGVTFNTASLIEQSDLSYETTTYTNYYTKVTTQYIPAVYFFSSKPKNIPGKDAYDWVITLQVSLTGEGDEETELIAQSEALEEFRKSLVDTPTGTFLLGATVYNFITSASDIVKIGDVEVQSGNKRILLAMDIYITNGIGLQYGNAFTLKLGLTGDTLYDIQPFNVSFIKGKSLETEMPITQTLGNALSVAIDGVFRIDLSMYFEEIAIMYELFSEILSQETTINKKYDIEITTPSTVVTKTVILNGGTITANLGTNIILGIQLSEAI